jgi:hypothetical protein
VCNPVYCYWYSLLETWILCTYLTSAAVRHSRAWTQRCSNPGHHVTRRLSSVKWRLKFMCPLNGTCFISPFWRLEFWGGFYVFGKSVDPVLTWLPFVYLRHLEFWGGFYIFGKSVEPVLTWLPLVSLRHREFWGRFYVFGKSVDPVLTWAPIVSVPRHKIDFRHFAVTDCKKWNLLIV